jgi:hypothetical protein
VIDFPNAPTASQIISTSAGSYIWTGVSWGYLESYVVTQIFLASGTWTVPIRAMWHEFTVIGGGQGGGGWSGGSQFADRYGGQGGEGGEIKRVNLTSDVVTGSSYAVTVATGGATSTLANTVAPAAGSSSVGSLVVAAGGSAGGKAHPSTPIPPASGFAQTAMRAAWGGSGGMKQAESGPGFSGQSGGASSTASGGVGTAAAGGNGVDGVIPNAGSGGAGGGCVGVFGAAGSGGRSGGGGGGHSAISSAGAGTKGGDGVVQITSYFTPPPSLTLVSISPTGLNVNTGPFTLTCTGTGFVQGDTEYTARSSSGFVWDTGLATVVSPTVCTFTFDPNQPGPWPITLRSISSGVVTPAQQFTGSGVSEA